MSANTYKLCNLNEVISNFNDIAKYGNSTDIIKSTEYITNDVTYNIINYKKDNLTPELYPSYGLVRSIIAVNGVIKAFSPPKCISYQSFITTTKPDDVRIEEMVEGSMINVFWDENDNKWHINTRRVLNANNSFNTGENKKPLSFKEMFEDIISEYEHFNLDCLNKKYSYSFVMQHPNNMIVLPINKKALYLVGVYEIVYENNEAVVYGVDLDYIKNSDTMKNTEILYPFVYPSGWNTYDNLLTNFGGENTSINILGVVMYNKITRQRTKIRNPNYERIRSLKGNQPNIIYNYIRLRKEKKVKEYLAHFSKHSEAFNKVRDNIHNFTNLLYSQYVSCYIKKVKPLKDFDEHFRTHMFKLHEIYTGKLRSENKGMNKYEVINYVNNLDSKLLMYSLNYPQE